MKKIERNIYVEDEIFKNEYEFVYGDKCTTLCYMVYYNIKSDACSCHISGTYSECLNFARKRASDGRYKNFEFIINIE